MFNDSPFEIIFVLESPSDVILEDLVELTDPLPKILRHIFHVRYHSHPTLMLQMLLEHELVAALEFLFAEVVEGLRQLSALHDRLVFGA
jgi:hypothetical protein